MHREPQACSESDAHGTPPSTITLPMQQVHAHPVNERE
jgi:hypothetical protein